MRSPCPDQVLFVITLGAHGVHSMGVTFLSGHNGTFNIQEDILFLLKPELGIISMTSVNAVWICSLAVSVCINVVSCVLQIMLQ